MTSYQQGRVVSSSPLNFLNRVQRNPLLYKFYPHSIQQQFPANKRELRCKTSPAEINQKSFRSF